MKSFNVNASKLTIVFTCEMTNEQVVLVFDEMPNPNYAAETVRDSENSNEQEFD